MQFNPASISPHVAFNKRRVPQPPPLFAWPDPNNSARRNKPDACLNKTKFSRVSFQAQYQAFVRFAVAGSAALVKPSRPITTCLLEPFTRTGTPNGISLSGSCQ